MYAYPRPAAAQGMYGYHYQPGQDHYHVPPVMLPPTQYAPPPPPPPRREPGFLEGCLMALRCCCLVGEYGGDTSGFGVF